VKNAQAFKGRGGEGRRGKGKELKGSPKSRTREIMQKLIFSMRAAKETLVPNLFMKPVRGGPRVNPSLDNMRACIMRELAK